MHMIKMICNIIMNHIFYVVDQQSWSSISYLLTTVIIRNLDREGDRVGWLHIINKLLKSITYTAHLFLNTLSLAPCY